MNHSDVQRSDAGVNVSASVISIGRVRCAGGARVVGAASSPDPRSAPAGQRLTTQSEGAI
jgi:hypothetical protein